jgi:flagellar biosynthesis/type III secretory pathway protein FliH
MVLMTVAELIQKLQEFPSDVEVDINTDDYGPVPVCVDDVYYDKDTNTVLL